MPQPVKISDALLAMARETASDAGRSIAGQVEHWAWVGRAIEAALTGAELSRLKRAAQAPPTAATDDDTAMRERIAKSLQRALSTDGHPAIAAQLARASVGPRYGTDPAFPGCLIREDEQGERTVGQWVGSEFVALEPQTSLKRRPTSAAVG